MFKVELKGDGLKRIQKDLKKLSAREGRKVAREANADGARLMKKAIKEATPVDTGFLKKNISFKKIRSENGVTTHRILYKSAFYAHFLERGTSKMEAHPFIVSTFDNTKLDVKTEVFKKLNSGLDKILK